MALLLKNGGVWKGLAAPSVRQSGLWETPKEIWTRDAGSWSKVWPTARSIIYTGVAENSKTLAKLDFIQFGPGQGPDYLTPFSLASNYRFQVNYQNGVAGSGTSTAVPGLNGAYVLITLFQLVNDTITYVDPNFRTNRPFVDPNTTIDFFNNTTGLMVEQWTAADSKVNPFGANNCHTFYAQNKSVGIVPLWDNPVVPGDTITITITGNF